jgi:hypothetical protein
LLSFTIELPAEDPVLDSGRVFGGQVEQIDHFIALERLASYPRGFTEYKHLDMVGLRHIKARVGPV